jgi:hypothetical protein
MIRKSDPWGLCPQTPGIYRFCIESKVGEARTEQIEKSKTGRGAPALLPIPGVALGSVPTVALSSTQAMKQ